MPTTHIVAGYCGDPAVSGKVFTLAGTFRSRSYWEASNGMLVYFGGLPPYDASWMIGPTLGGAGALYYRMTTAEEPLGQFTVVPGAGTSPAPTVSAYSGDGGWTELASISGYVKLGGVGLEGITVRASWSNTVVYRVVAGSYLGLVDGNYIYTGDYQGDPVYVLQAGAGIRLGWKGGEWNWVIYNFSGAGTIDYYSNTASITGAWTAQNASPPAPTVGEEQSATLFALESEGITDVNGYYKIPWIGDTAVTITVAPQGTTYDYTPTSREVEWVGVAVENVDFAAAVKTARTAKTFDAPAAEDHPTLDVTSTVYQSGNLAADTVAAFEGQGHGRFVGDMACDTIADFSYLYWPKPTPSSDKTYWRRRSQFQAETRRVSKGRSLAWLDGPPATGITLGLFHALEADFETVAATGFNTVLSAAWPNVLGQTVASVVAASDAAGLLAGVILPDTPETSQIAAYGSHDAVRAWYAQDEPNTQTDWEDRLTTLQGYKDEWDTEKPIMVCCNYASADEYRDRFRAFLAESEIVCHNNYPYRYNLWPMAYTFETPTGLMTNMPIAQDIAEREDREHWVILQAHGQNSTTTGLAMPSAKFLRAQAYASLIQGATGLIWFCMDNAYIRSASLYGVAPSVPQDYGEGGLVISEAQAYWASYAWAAIAAIVADVSRLEDVWLAPTSALDYVITFDEESVTWSKDPICAILKEYEGDYYLFIANIENYPHGVQVILPIEPSVETLLGPTASIEGGTLSVELGAWGVWGGKLTT